MRTIARMRLLVGMIVVMALLPAQAAFAHAQLVSTEPAANAVLDTPPSRLMLTFNEAVSPLRLSLIGPDGETTQVSNSVTGFSIEVKPATAVSDGTHVLSWRVVSDDGHPIGGSLVFAVGEVTGAASPAAATGSVTSVLLWLSKAALFFCLFLGVGGCAFAALSPLPRLARKTASGLCLVGVGAATMSLGLHGVDALAVPIASVFDGAVWAAALSTSYGYTAVGAGISFLAAFRSLRMPRDIKATGIGLVAGGLAALSLALSGHASAAVPQWLTRSAVFLHIGGVLFWVGALLPLWLLLRERSEASQNALAMFSRRIPYAVAPLVASGAILAVVQMGYPGAQWLTPYGFILAAKLGLLLALFALALINRFGLTKPALAGNAVRQQQLRRAIGLELVLVIFILGPVAGWRFTPPPRALALSPAKAEIAESLVVHLMDDKTMATIQMEPDAAGPVVLGIMIADAAGAPKAVEGVSVRLSSPTLGIESIKRAAVAAGRHWRVDDLTIPVPGDWMLEVEVRVSRFELSRLRTEVAIP